MCPTFVQMEFHKYIYTDSTFLHSSQLTTGPVIVHVYVVIYFCDNMWSFEIVGIEVALCRFLLFVYICIAFGDPVIKGWDHINRFNSPTFLCLS